MMNDIFYFTKHILKTNHLRYQKHSIFTNGYFIVKVCEQNRDKNQHCI